MKNFQYNTILYIVALLCVFVPSNRFVFAAGPYSPGSTLMPDCVPGDADCTVSIIPDQTSNNGKILKTDGSALSWTDTLSLDTVTFTGSALIPGIFSTPKGSDHTTTGNQNDVDFGATSLVRYTGNNVATFTGVSGGSDGRMIRITNASSYNITLKNQDPSSTAINRIITTSGGDVIIPPNVSVTLQYDNGDSRWRIAILPATSATISTFAYLQNGNSFGSTAVLGTNDAHELDLRTNGITALNLDTSGNGTLSGDLHINGDDLFMGTNSSGAVLVADGTNFNPVVMSGDATIAANGALTINYSGAQSADATHKGFLTAADWNTFNSKQSALGFTAEDVSNKSTNTALGTSNTLYPTQNAVKTYVDNLSLGLTWKNPVEIINVIGNASSPVGSPANLDVYIIDTGGNTGAWSGFNVGDMVQYQTNQWVFIKAMSVGDRFGISFKSSTSASGSMAGKDNYLAQITGGSSGNFSYTFTAPSNSDAVYVQNQNAYYHNVSFTYSSSLSEWVQLSASVDYSFSSGFQAIGTAVSLGALTSDWNQTGAYNINTAGDINLNGGDLITSASTANVFNTNATTLNIGGAATAINLGASGAVVTGAGALSINSGITAALTIDSGTTGALNLGTGNNAKTINLGTGTAGNTINLGTNNTIADTIAIGSALDALSFASTGLNVSTGGALTGVVSIDTIAHSATALTFAGTGTVASTGSNALTIDSGTTGALNLGTGNNAKTINLGTGTAGNTINLGTNNTIADTIAIGSALDALSFASTGLNVSTGGALTGVVSIDTIAHSATALTFAGTGTVASGAGTALNITSGTTGAVTIDSGSTGAVNLGSGSNAKTVTVGNTTGATALNLFSGSGNINLQVAGTGTVGNIQVGAGGAGSATPDMFVLDIKNTSGDPSGTNGAMYYNSNTNKFRCYENGAWSNCMKTASDIQHAVSRDSSEALTNITSSQTVLGTVSVTPSTATGDIFVSGKADVLSSNATDQSFNLVIETTSNCTGSTVGSASVTYTITSGSGTDRGTVYVSGIAVDPGASSQSYSLCASTATGDTDVMNWNIEAIVIDTGADVAEIYTTYDENIGMGEVVSIDPMLKTGVAKSSGRSDHEVIGIVSTKPGMVIGNVDQEGVRAVPVALSGRVPVKVNTENGSIHVGDYLAPSSVPGIAMKYDGTGAVVAQAMEEYGGAESGLILAFVKNFDTRNNLAVSQDTLIGLPDDIDGASALSTVVAEPSRDAVASIREIFSSGGKLIAHFFTARVTAIRGYFDEIFSKTLHSEKICLKKSDSSEVCINGDELETVLYDTDISGSVQPLHIPVPSSDTDEYSDTIASFDTPPPLETVSSTTVLNDSIHTSPLQDALNVPITDAVQHATGTISGTDPDSPKGIGASVADTVSGQPYPTESAEKKVDTAGNSVSNDSSPVVDPADSQ